MTETKTKPIKTYISVRQGKHSIQIRRCGYKQKSEKLCTIKGDLSDSNGVESLLINDVERQKWTQEKEKISRDIRRKQQAALLDRGLDYALLDLYHELTTLQERDPQGKDQENRELAKNVWLIWNLIRPLISSKTTWHVLEDDAKKVLPDKKMTHKNIQAALTMRLRRE